MRDETDMPNIALGQAALQSSFSQYSDTNDPLRAVNGEKTGYFSFCTAQEVGPWWILDLGSIKRVYSIRVFNRCDAGRERARNLSIEVYDPGIGAWCPVYVAENEFGGATYGTPLFLDFGKTPKCIRFIKIQVRGEGMLHLDEVEVYGLPHQALYEDTIKKCLDRLRLPPVTEARTSKEIGAIVGLVRGYKEVDEYAPLIARNRAIFEVINKNKKATSGYEYPLIIWHEGNISALHQKYILSFEENSRVTFIDISSKWKLPQGVKSESFEEHWPLGYRLMCKFNAWDIWDLAADFEFLLRVDEDCVLQHLDHDPFEWAKRAGIDSAFSILISDAHQITNDTLPAYAQAYMKVAGYSTEMSALTTLYPYSNIMMGRTDFFLSSPMSEFLLCAIEEPDFYIKRWGDHVVLGIVLHLFSDYERNLPIPGLRYAHHSHSLVICSNDLLRSAQPRPSEPAVFADSLFLEESELLRRFAAYPFSKRIRSSLAAAASANGRHELAARLAAAS